KMGIFADAVLHGANAGTLLAGVTAFELASPSGSASGTIDQFAPVKVAVPAARLTSTSSTSQPGPVDWSALTGHLSMGSVGSASVSALANAVLAVDGSFDYTSSIPVSAQVPYFGISAHLDNMLLSSLRVSGLALARQSGNMSPSARFVFQNQPGLPDSFAAALTAAQTGSLAAHGSIYVDGFVFGSSAAASNALFSKIRYDVTDLAAAALSTKAGSTESASNFSAVKNYTLQEAALSFLPKSSVGFGVGMSLDTAFPVQVQIPYFAAGGYLDTVYAGKVTLRLAANSSGLNVAGDAAINDVPELADKIGVISAALLDENQPPVPGVAVPANLVVGVSATDSIDLFSKVKLPGIQLSGLVSAQRATQGGGVGGMLNYSGLGVAALPNKVLQLTSVISLDNQYPVTVSGLGYLHGAAGLDDTVVTQLSAPGFALGKGQNQLNVTLNALFPSSPEIQNAVARFASDLAAHPGTTLQYVV
ncbi:hypothetical protein HDU91_002418, partial [Kappamyces sp. JEL0680]